ncbi:hypothetical protein BaRGS_00039940 [Batillaria attramentaria]|uniref:Secreted protein n=1 Tax=Batillaria attramentaria TaxID=370345 RepID=A0ABD0J1R1_9CAEN
MCPLSTTASSFLFFSVPQFFPLAQILANRWTVAAAVAQRDHTQPSAEGAKANPPVSRLSKGAEFSQAFHRIPDCIPLHVPQARHARLFTPRQFRHSPTRHSQLLGQWSGRDPSLRAWLGT